MSRAFIANWRLRFLSGTILVFFLIVLGRLYYLHVWEREKLVRIIEHNRERIEIRKARRGNIVDSRGNLLAATRTVVELGADPQLAREEDVWKYPRLALLAGLSGVELKKKMGERKVEKGERYRHEVKLIRWRKLADGVSESTYAEIRKLGIEGVYGNRKFERFYPGRELASHLLGFMNRDNTAVSGVEKFMDFYLRGQDGWRETEQDGTRREMARFRDREIEPRNGYNVETTLDLVVQHLIEEELENIVREYAPQSATIIVSEPSTGFILGLANVPTFDPNQFWKYPMASLRNRAVTDVFEPGSTFKIVAASGALNENRVNLSTLINCSRIAVRYRGRMIELPQDYKTFGILSTKDIVVKSSNRGAAQLGMMLGERQLRNYAAAFGFGEKSGYQLGGEASGVLLPLKRWDPLTISRLPIGYAVSATILQVHFAMSVIANEGVLMTPRVVRRVFDENGVTVAGFEPRPKRRVISLRSAETMARVLTEVASPGGTAPRAHIPGYEVAGKTGTTRKILKGEYSANHHVASFAGFFPASNPRLLITVVVNDPGVQGAGYGGRIAAPSFRAVAEKLIRYYGLKPTREEAPLLAWKGGGVR